MTDKPDPIDDPQDPDNDPPKWEKWDISEWKIWDAQFINPARYDPRNYYFALNYSQQFIPTSPLPDSLRNDYTLQDPIQWINSNKVAYPLKPKPKRVRKPKPPPPAPPEPVLLHDPVCAHGLSIPCAECDPADTYRWKAALCPHLL